MGIWDGSRRAWLNGYRRHVRNCAVVRELLGRSPSRHLENLYWYDLRLPKAVAPAGLARVLRRGFASAGGDAIAHNHGVQPLYTAPPPVRQAGHSFGEVWTSTTLRSKPFHDAASQVRDMLAEHGAAIAEEIATELVDVDVHPDNGSLTASGTWTGEFLFRGSGRWNEGLRRRLPVTSSVVERLPLCQNFGFVMISGVLPGTRIAPHRGSTNLRLRHHLGISVPEPEKAQLRVGSEWRTWKNGEVLAFDDSFEHEVVHDGTRPRVVLSVDTWHPDLSVSDISVLAHPVFRTFGKVEQV